MRSFIIGLFILLTYNVFAQEYEQAIVTDLNFIRRPSYHVNAANFPFYFQYKEFASDVQNEISMLVKEKFKVNDVLFFNPDSIYYADLAVTPKTEAKDYARVTKRDKTLFISIETILQSEAIIDNETIYRFTTRINVYDYRGKNIYKFKNHIPFVSVYGDEIAGKINMSELDFYNFYFDGLNLAFEGKNKIITKRYITKPATAEYAEFLYNSNKIYLETELNGYSYGTDLNNLSEIVSFTINYWDTPDNKFDFANLVRLEFLDNGYNFINKLNQKEYSIKLKGGTEALNNKFNPMADIEFQLSGADKTHVGFFVYHKIDSLYGKYNGEYFNLKWKADYSCIEVYIKNDLYAIINVYPGSKVLYLSKNINKEQFTALINLLFLYDYGLAIRERLFSVYN